MTSRNALIAFSVTTSLYVHIAAASEGDPSNGANIFTAQCSICHSLKEGKNKIGPSLAGVVGRPAGHATNYSYSDALINSGVTWNTETLNTYLANPSAMIPGMKMPYQGLADEKLRLDLIAYLSVQAGK